MLLDRILKLPLNGYTHVHSTLMFYVFYFILPMFAFVPKVSRHIPNYSIILHQGARKRKWKLFLVREGAGASKCFFLLVNVCARPTPFAKNGTSAAKFDASTRMSPRYCETTKRTFFSERRVSSRKANLEVVVKC